MSAEPRAAAPSLLDRLLAGEPVAIAKAITAVENGRAGGLLAGIEPRLGNALVVGVTGPPGVGKSTLVSALIGAFRDRGKTVGVVAVDPSSPISGGAILGDRVRMAAHGTDRGVFVRSVASRGHLGGLAPAAGRIVDVMDAAGKDVVIVETVGTGQAEVEVAEIADVKLVVCAPGLGDDIQALKAGVLEIADVLVVNKADLAGAQATRAQLESMLSLRRREQAGVPVLATTATDGGGLADLMSAIDALAAARPPRRDRGHARLRQLLAETAAELVHDCLDAPDAAALCRAVDDGEMDIEDAARRLLRLSAGRDDD